MPSASRKAPIIGRCSWRRSSTYARAAKVSCRLGTAAKYRALRSVSRPFTVLIRNFNCCAMSAAACAWSSLASSSRHSACAAARRWSAVIRFHKREGVVVGSVIAAILVRPRLEDRAGVPHEHLVDLIVRHPGLAQRGQDVVGDVRVLPLRPGAALVVLGE